MLRVESGNVRMAKHEVQGLYDIAKRFERNCAEPLHNYVSGYMNLLPPELHGAAMMPGDARAHQALLCWFGLQGSGRGSSSYPAQETNFCGE